MPLEAHLDAAGADAVIADWPDRRRGSALRADLAAMEVPSVPDRGGALPFNTSAAIAGAIYVLEGSRLGGRFLARQVGENLPHTYLDSNQEPGSWRDLLAKLDAILYETDRMKIAVDAARTVFDRFDAAGRRWLAKE